MGRSISFELDGVQHTVEVEREGNSLHMTHQGETFTVTLHSAEQAGVVATSPPALAPSAPAAPTPTSAAAASATAAAPGDVVAPMTGTVREMKVAAGASVTEGQMVLVMEAMKMDIDVFAPIAGTVSEVLVRDGQSVVETEVLARIG